MLETEIRDLLDQMCLNADQGAFKQLYFYYYERLFRLTKFYTRSSEAAEEIIDDIFIAIWENRHSMDHISDLTAYLYRAAKNRSLNFLHQAKSVELMDISELEHELKDTSLNVEDQLIVADLAQFVAKAVEKLPEQCRLVYSMVRNDAMSHKQVAELLNISVRTVEYHMGTALKKLAESLKSYRNALIKAQ